MGGDFAEALKRALAAGDAAGMEKIILEKSSFEFAEPAIGILSSEKEFEGLLSLMRDQQLWRFPKSSICVQIWDHEWGTLSEERRRRLLEVLEEVAPHFTDRQSNFMISELLGENFSIDASLPVLERMAHSRAENVRAFVPHALTDLHRRAPEGLARDRIEKLLAEIGESSAE